MCRAVILLVRPIGCCRALRIGADPAPLLFAGMNLPLEVSMLTGFMEDLPLALIEAARVDGASLWQEFTRVLLPLLVPGLAATALLALIFT